MSMKKVTQVSDGNPWKGLNFYLEGETLYGRDNEIQSLAQYIINNTQTVLYGKSGIGKSSIVNAGIFPIARKEGLYPIPIRLKHDKDSSYIDQVKKVFQASGIGMTEVVPVIDESKETLWEFIHRHSFYNAETGVVVRPLVVFDQFEEIFTLQHDENKKKDFFSELADLLNEVTPQYVVDANDRKSVSSDTSAASSSTGFVLDFGSASDDDSDNYVSGSLFNLVFSIREDFLSYLERYTAYIPVMKTNRYALLPINEEQAADIIMKPREGLVSKSVAELIIQKVTGRSDFKLDGIPEIDVDAAVLSLYLSRLYIKKGDAPTITSKLVNQFSEDIIKDFYTESVSDLPTKDIEEIEDQLLTYDGRRNNVSRNDLIREGVSEDVIRTLVEDKKLLRQFSYQDDIRVEFMHDILCPIVDARINQREEQKRQEEERKRQEEEQHQFVEKMEREARRQRKKNRIRMISVLSLLAFFLISSFTWYFLFSRNYHSYYASFTTRDGWPVGIGDELGSKDKKAMVIHYRLTRRGILTYAAGSGIQKSHNIKVEILNSEGKPANNIMVESPLVSLSDGDNDYVARSRDFALMQRHTSKWVFTADENGNISRQTAYDIKGEELYSVQYYRSSASDESETVQTLWMNYVDHEGKSLRVCDNGADRMRVTVNDGYFTSYQFFNEQGTPQQNSRGAYGYVYELDQEKGYRKTIIPLDEYGDSVKGQVTHFTQFDDYYRWIAADNAKAEYGPDRIIYSMADRIDTLLYDKDGRLAYRSETMHKQRRWHTFAYDLRGNLTDKSVYKLNSGNQPLLLSRLTNKYNESGDLLLESLRYAENDTVRYQRETHEFSGTTHTIRYFSGNSPSGLQPANRRLVRNDDTIYYHRQITTEKEVSNIIHKTNTYMQIGSGGSELFLLSEEEYFKSGMIPWRKIVTKADGMTLSLEYETSNGLVVGQHVLGLDDTPIRCPNWDDKHQCYYHQKFIRSFSGDIVAVKAVNEFGEESMITYLDKDIHISVVPGYKISQEGEQDITFGIGIYRYGYTDADESRKVDYLHITDQSGTYYQCGLRDGDLILSTDPNKVTVARPILDAKERAKKGFYYEVKTFTPQAGDKGMEHYSVYFTETEMSHFTESINKNH